MFDFILATSYPSDIPTRQLPCRTWTVKPYGYGPEFVRLTYQQLS